MTVWAWRFVERILSLSGRGFWLICISIRCVTFISTIDFFKLPLKFRNHKFHVIVTRLKRNKSKFFTVDFNFLSLLHKSNFSSNSPFRFGLSLPSNKFDYSRHERQVESNTVVNLHLPWAQLCLNENVKVQNCMTHSLTIYIHPSSNSSPIGSLSPFLSK